MHSCVHTNLQAAHQQTEAGAVSSARPSPPVGGSVLVSRATSSTKMANAALQPVSHPMVVAGREAHTHACLCFRTHCLKIQGECCCGGFIHEILYSYPAGLPAFLIVANLVDVRRINPDGTEDQILLKEPRGTILALDYDPVQNQVKTTFPLCFMFFSFSPPLFMEYIL